MSATTTAPAPPPPAAPAPAPARAEDRPEPEPLVDPETVAQMAPMAMMAGAALLPMIGSALTGLLGGGSGTGAAPAGAAPAGAAGGPAMDPESQEAMKALKALESVYGDGEPTDPGMKKLREKVTGSDEGSGDGPQMVKAKRLFQANRGAAFNNLDKQFVNYLNTLGTSNKVDQNAVRRLLKMTNEALAELGPMAYTKEGQQKVRQILTAALQTAHKIVSGGTANNGDTASAINQLTNQYLYNIIGKPLPGGVKFTAAAAAVRGGSERAQFAVKTALAQIGDPYVWGAVGPNSFDCSGLTQYAARQAGVNIPRVANDQYRQLPAVNPANIQPGDLIFPSTSMKNGQMGHVMMYIGNGQVVHAPRSGENVKITSLPRSYEARRFA
ncbi:C40 family peptidase [Nocardia sp. NPDC002869]|uniref:C40 family peptidase n=1 Tax=Nocardia sp. NPDC002869 TaxID=3161032 RepID=UPI00398C9204